MSPADWNPLSGINKKLRSALSRSASTSHCQGVFYTHRGLILPNFRMTLPVYLLITPLISHGGPECYFYSPHLWLLQQYLNIALTMHNNTWQKRVDKRVVKCPGMSINTVFQWNKCDIIFQLLGASSPSPHRGSASGLRWGISAPHPPDLPTQLDTPNYQILENTLVTARTRAAVSNNNPQPSRVSWLPHPVRAKLPVCILISLVAMPPVIS